jgi:phosphodiester glycosidase
VHRIIIGIVLLAGFSTAVGDAVPSPWQRLAPGLELGTFGAQANAHSIITVLRIDPKLWQLTFAGISQTNESSGHTAREWSDAHKFTAAINAGMFDTDGKTHTGYLRSGDHVNSSRVITKYQSVAAFDPHDSKQAAPFHIFDLDTSGVTLQNILKEYSSAVQNLRLIKRPGLNQWGQQEKKWSEAALGEDDTGRILFIFSRSPFSMHDLNQELLSAGIGVVAAQHLEGGPEAQLYIHVGKMEREMFGSYETSFEENDSNARPWPVPNVLGIRPR